MNADELLFYLSHGFQLSQERRADIRADLQERQAHTDRLMAMSGQPLQEEPPQRRFMSGTLGKLVKPQQYKL